MLIVALTQAIEFLLILSLSFGAVYFLRVSHIFEEVSKGVGYFYPLSNLQAFILISIIVSMLGVFVIFTYGTKRLKWFGVLIFILCMPSIVSHTGILENLREQYMIDLNIEILYSDISTSNFLLFSMALVAGFILLHQLVSLEEMHRRFRSQSIEEGDISKIYKARILFTFIILLIGTILSYFIIKHSSNLKTVFIDSMNFNSIVSMIIVVLFAFVIAAFIFKLLNKKSGLKTSDRVSIEESGFGSKLADESISVLAIVIPTPASARLTRIAKRIIIVLTKPFNQRKFGGSC